VRNVADRVEIFVALGPRVLLSDVGAKLDMRSDRLTERLIVGKTGLVECLQVEGNEPVPLLVGDLQMPVNVNDVVEAQFAGESVGTTERLAGEPRQVVDVSRYALREHRLEHRIGKHFVIEELLEAVQALVAARVFVKRFHRMPPLGRLRLLALSAATHRAPARLPSECRPSDPPTPLPGPLPSPGSSQHPYLTSAGRQSCTHRSRLAQERSTTVSTANINRVVMTARLTKDPELRSLRSGTSVCELRVACNTPRKNSTTGEWEDRPNFFDVKAWGGQGENAARYLARGRAVAIDGRLQWREWETQEGAKRQAVEIIAESIQFLGSRDQTAAADGGDLPADADFQPAEAPAGAGAGDDDIPF